LAGFRGNGVVLDVAARSNAAWIRLTARERILAVLMALLALATAAFTAASWSADQRDRYAAAQADLMLARQTRLALRGGSEAPAQARLAIMSGWTTPARNIWMARIALEQALTAAADRAGLPDPEIRVAEGLEGDAALPMVKVEVSGPYVAGPFTAFLSALAQDRRAFVVDRLRIDDVDTARYRLELLFPVAIEPGA